MGPSKEFKQVTHLPGWPPLSEQGQSNGTDASNLSRTTARWQPNNKFFWVASRSFSSFKKKKKGLDIYVGSFINSFGLLFSRLFNVNKAINYNNKSSITTTRNFVFPNFSAWWTTSPQLLTRNIWPHWRAPPTPVMCPSADSSSAIQLACKPTT